ncbi:MAG: quinone oxidoreductase [Pseudomonadota bacterium]
MTKAIHVLKPGTTENMRFVDVETPTPSNNEMLIRHTAIGVNFIDIYIRNKAYPWPVEKNLILGCEAAGIVEKIGPDVKHFKLGERVAYVSMNGAYASHRAIAHDTVVKLPDNVSDEQASASMLKGLTVYYLLHNSFKIEKNHIVLFHAAAGGVGLIAGQWLSDLNAIAIGCAGSTEKCNLAKQYGYQHTINYKDSDVLEQVMKITNSKGVDAVYDSVGKDTMRDSLKALKQHGTLVSFGQASGTYDAFKISDLATGSLHLTRPSLFHFLNDPQWLKKASQALFEKISTNKIKIPIKQRFALKDAAFAHQSIEARKTTGSTILIP